jgi:hypothetical protein
VRAKPTGSYARRIWFLYEWLTVKTLDLPAAEKGTYTPVVDPEQQWAVDGENSPRHRVRNNLPGTPAFCPLVYRTKSLEQYVAMNMAERARVIVAAVPADLMARTAAFLLLKDSRSSYIIEGENPPQGRIQRWGRAIGEAGRRPLDLDELLRLQRIVIGVRGSCGLGCGVKEALLASTTAKAACPFPAISARVRRTSDR